LGYVEGQSLVMEWRFAEGHEGRLPAFAAELLALPVDLMLTTGPVATRVARDASRTLPIVMCFPGDPIGLGIIESLDRPGGNITGMASLTTELNAKRLEFFAGALPGRSGVAVLWDRHGPGSARQPLASAGQALGPELAHHEIETPEEIPAAIKATVTRRAEALFLTDSTIFTEQRQQIVHLALDSRLPVSASNRDLVEDGALLSYAARVPDMYRRAASSVDKILKGAKPADLPVERPPTFDLVINLGAAKALELIIPQSILQQATEFIQ
jgi:putative tryptophan/tyrosine transport system substrate-binding protein